MARRRTRTASAAPLAIFLALLLVCLLGAIGYLGAGMMTDSIQAAFGPPDASLSPLQQVLATVRLGLAREALLEPAASNGTEVPFTIESGASPSVVAERLEADGLIRDADAFRRYLIYSGIDRRIQAGEYRLSPAMTGVEIAQQLQDATPDEVTFHILPGWRAEEIAASLPTSGLAVTSDEFLGLVYDFPAEWLPADWPPLSSVEGFLAPGEYTFSREASAETMVQAFVARSAEVIDAELIAGFERQGLTLTEAVTLASIVEKEGVAEEERPLIASVFYNRLAAGMKLDSDPTAQYAVGYNEAQATWWTNPLSVADLQVDSPYNTYVYGGLPPGPICNPALSALRAVAYPAETPYYYFRARCDGSGQHEFAVTYDEHLQNGCD
ncbi:MAG TPA: endolytic transglycosylase MltG [Anaerolineaceae bacterium]|nr:endolytic transglycosylase MltG [Anaerolineaceae bacterium]